jgi:hypothetical protein
VSFLHVTGLYPTWYGHFFFQKDKDAKRARSICNVRLLAGAVKEDYGAGAGDVPTSANR